MQIPTETISLMTATQHAENSKAYLRGGRINGIYIIKWKTCTDMI